MNKGGVDNFHKGRGKWPISMKGEESEQIGTLQKLKLF
jgi:hypothetical protein